MRGKEIEALKDTASRGGHDTANLPNLTQLWHCQILSYPQALQLDLYIKQLSDPGIISDVLLKQGS